MNLLILLGIFLIWVIVKFVKSCSRPRPYTLTGKQLDKVLGEMTRQPTKKDALDVWRKANK